MSDLVIRPMRPRDVEEATAILAAWNMAPEPDRPHPERTELIVENSFVATEGDRVIGVASFLRLSDEVAETASLAVHPDYRGRGVGTRLQRARLQEMRRRGFEKVRTETDRPETIRWYVGKFGYRVLGTSPKKHEFSLRDIDEWTVLELNLKEEPEDGGDVGCPG